jgi:hypothetical protein
MNAFDSALSVAKGFELEDIIKRYKFSSDIEEAVFNLLNNNDPTNREFTFSFISFLKDYRTGMGGRLYSEVRKFFDEIGFPLNNSKRKQKTREKKQFSKSNVIEEAYTYEGKGALEGYKSVEEVLNSLLSAGYSNINEEIITEQLNKFKNKVSKHRTIVVEEYEGKYRIRRTKLWYERQNLPIPVNAAEIPKPKKK